MYSDVELDHFCEGTFLSLFLHQPLGFCWMTWILTKIDSFRTGEGQGLAIGIALSVLDRCCDSRNGLLSYESDEISRHREWEEQLEVVDWPRQGLVSSGCCFHSSTSSVWPYRLSHDVGPPDLELG
ncbi:hypothetical protein Acr_11g0009690 [Actinidia rufa]|uniref:Uncharacterized protein n=1 Tax=Actinidia rufa TaxID=165716 RepID=A0A7J0FDK6_9ERIC|nr:hypothetical protein Acr_11g0009690 [Actinidia rufa]